MEKWLLGDVTVVAIGKERWNMKRMATTLSTIIMAGIIFGTSSISVHAFDLQEHYEKMKDVRLFCDEIFKGKNN